MLKPQFVKNEIYHIYNRGVEKRKIFLEKRDYLRFIHDLFEFNNENPVSPSNIRFSSRLPSQINTPLLEKCLEGEPLNIGAQDFKNISSSKLMIRKRPPAQKRPRKLLVEILAFSLMSNHFHLLLRQKKERGIVRFMQKLGTGYTMYFNQKYERVGPLFQGRFKAMHVNKSDYLKYLLYYIHFNCLDLIGEGWTDGKIKNSKRAVRFLTSYRWSSHLDYLGQKNFPSLTQRSFLLKVLGGRENYEETIEEWLKEIEKMTETEEFKAVTLE